MKFMTIVKGNENAGVPPKALFDAIDKLMADQIKSGIFVDAGGLEPTSKAARVRISGGRISVIDGPFTEAKEVIGGYWMINVRSRDEAIEWAKRCPGSDNEVIEIRQVQEFEDFTPEVQEAAAGFPELKAQKDRKTA